VDSSSSSECSDSFSLSYINKKPHNYTVHYSVFDCLLSVYNYVMCLKQVPNSTQQWQEVASNFWQLWNFPHCLRAVDGKHIKIMSPVNSGSMYFNYKHYFSVVLMALVDAHYKFLFVDVGCYGRYADVGVFNSCSLSAALEADITFSEIIVQSYYVT